MSRDPWYKSFAGLEVEGYVLKKYVGSGKIGFVYEAHRKDMPAWPLAIKLTPGNPRPGWENEIGKAASLRGITGVVTFHSVGTHLITHNRRSEVFLYTVWDFVSPGRNLNQYLKEVSSCPTSFLIAVIHVILNVLHACEKRGVKRHGDLHAGNILIGELDDAVLDSSFNARVPVYVSDFGYGATGQEKTPKDDYDGLVNIIDAVIEKTEWDQATTTDRQLITALLELLPKLLREQTQSERRTPKEILLSVNALIQRVQSSGGFRTSTHLKGSPIEGSTNIEGMTVGQFQVSEMLGDDWERWRRLFVPEVPAKSRILEPDAHTIITGPRGCGKTMLLRRLSERLMVECGPLNPTTNPPNFLAFYVNANDIADAFSSFHSGPQGALQDRLICYANLSVLSDFLAVQSARSAQSGEQPPESLLNQVSSWLLEQNTFPLITGEDPLEHFRSVLEQIKWKFPRATSGPHFPAFQDFAQHAWLPRMISTMRQICPWVGSKTVFIFVDDYTTPRISVRMQKTLNRLLFQRTGEFVSKVATESATTFVAADSSGKVLQDGDDYQLIDMGEESLFMSDEDRSWFLGEIFNRRLSLDSRIAEEARSLSGLLGSLGLGKLEFARRLRGQSNDFSSADVGPVPSGSQRRGRTRTNALYHGREVFTDLWSGDTRTMIQLVQELVDVATPAGVDPALPINSEIQDRVFRNRGSQWLDAQARNQPTNRTAFQRGLGAHVQNNPQFKLTGGGYGGHLKAIVEAFAKVARQLLLGPMYHIVNPTGTFRDVPRMAFRIEVTDEFRIDGLAAEIYKDLIRYGMFMRDARGKSVRGAFVPRLYMRRLLLPYATLALSKRDSVQMNCESFINLLLAPDEFAFAFRRRIAGAAQSSPDQLTLSLQPDNLVDESSNPLDIRYDDLELED